MKDSKPLSTQEILDRLDEMDSQSSAGPKTVNKRQELRWSFRKFDVPISIEHPGGGVHRLLVPCRNVSTGGLSFLHKGFLHPGTVCVAVLTKRDSKPMPVRGFVAHCRYAGNGVHEVGLRFERRIQIHHILNTNDSSAQATTSVELPDLRGRMLYLDDNPMDQVLLSHHLRASGIELTAVQNVPAAMQAMELNLFDIIMTDLNLGSNTDSVQFITDARQKHFSGPILLVTADPTGARATAARAAGATHVLGKPYEMRELFDILIVVHRQAGAVVMAKPIYSGVEDQPEMRDALTRYVSYCHETSDKLDELIQQDKTQEVRELVLNIKGTAGGFGFASVGDAAGGAVVQIDSTMSCQESKAQLRTLCLLLKNVSMRK